MPTRSAPVAQACQDVPRCGYGEQKDDSGQGPQAFPMGGLTRKGQVKRQRSEGEGEGDEAFGEHTRRQREPEQQRPAAVV